MPAVAAPSGDDFDETADWQKVYEEFVTHEEAVQRADGEPDLRQVQGHVAAQQGRARRRHGCTRVKFTVYVKDGKAALKASPVK